jgi:hypothetical protein
VWDLIGQLWEDQAEIALVHRAWQMIPLRFFEGEEERTRFRAEAVRRGLFRNLVARAHGGSVESASLPELHYAQAVLEEWRSILAGESGGDRQGGAPEVKSIAPDPIDEAIRRQYERVWAGRGQLRERAKLLPDVEREFRRLRELQAIQAREMKKTGEAALALPWKEVRAAVAEAKRLLSP